MIEVGQCGLGLWHWTMIGASGRVLVYRSNYATEAAALFAARRFRCDFFALAEEVDGRAVALI